MNFHLGRMSGRDNLLMLYCSFTGCSEHELTLIGGTHDPNIRPYFFKSNILILLPERHTAMV